MKKPEGPSSALLYLVGTQVLLLTVGVAVIRVVSGGPGQSALLLPEITDGNVPGNLHRIEGRTDNSMLYLISFCLVRPCVTDLKYLKVFCAQFVFNEFH